MDELQNLNEEQRKAVLALEGAYLVLAGAGSGKTRVVTLRIAHLIRSGITPTQILGVTFTNKAAEEMRARVNKLTQNQVIICTFHSLGARVLRECIGALNYSPHFTIYDEEDVNKLIQTCLTELEIPSKKSDLKVFRTLISQAKNAMQSPDEVSTQDLDPYMEEAFQKTYALYQQKLKQYEAIDFDDLLYLTVKIWSEFPEILARYQHRWPFVLIDEYQDTNATQYQMIRLLAEKSGNLFVVGDPDQSIYSWRGANIKNILNFERDYPGAQVIRLQQNYRSTNNILNLANGLIAYNSGRYEKELWSDLGDGEKAKLYVGDNDRSEADFVASQVVYHQVENHISLGQMVIFYRTNAQSRVFEDSFLSRRIPYLIVGGISFYQRREIKDILAFLRMAQSGADYLAFLRTINLPKRGLGDSAIEKIRHGANQERLTLLAYCEALVDNQPLQHPCKLSPKQKEGLHDYVKIIKELHELSKSSTIKNLVQTAIELSNYLNYLELDKETYRDRRDNLNELITKSIEWEESASIPTLEAFLEELSLKSTLDELDPTHDRVSLMTIHNGKGLEFEVAFLVGLENGLFPHINSMNSPMEVEEERRLCYVGITRAKRYLYLSYCRTRYLWGTLRSQDASPFLFDMPKEYIEKFKSPKFSDRDFPLVEKTNFLKPIAMATKSIAPTANLEIFSAGDCIFHPEFGIGQVQEAADGSMGITYKVLFNKDNHVRTLIGKYAPISRLQ